MRILGIDPGIARMGWGIIKTDNLKLRVEGYGCFETQSKELSVERLKKIHVEVTRLIKQYKPEAIAVEELFFNTNVKTAFLVGQARGVILLACAESNIPSSIYTPLQVKQAVSGYGRAGKEQVGRMVKVLLKLEVIPKPDDVTDALAVAITHAFTFKKNQSA
ncbi:crossover junction endodeoxyribonuclease RuvC [Patescibacteria group bacterium]|nr:crossover junction endodeoxyribonuclease RuvC [Patescibacteria group bacterium]